MNSQAVPGQCIFSFDYYLCSGFSSFPSSCCLMLCLKGPFSSTNGCVGSPPHLDLFDMKPVEEAVKSTTPFVTSTLNSKQTVELFSGKKILLSFRIVTYNDDHNMPESQLLKSVL